MAKRWSEVESSPQYQALPDQEKQMAKQQYFDSVVSTKPEFTALSPDEQGAAKSQFFGSAQTQQPIQPQAQQPTESMATQGMDYLRQHPVKSLVDPIAKTLTGSSISETVDNKMGMEPFTRNFDLYGNNPLANAKAIAEGTTQGIMANVADMVTSPVAQISQMKGVQQLGTALANTKAGKAVGNVMNADVIKSLRGGVNRIARNINNIKDPAKFGQEVRGSLFEAKRAVGKTFENDLNALVNKNPDGRINLSNELGMMKNAVDNQAENPGLAQQINAVIRKIKNPEDAKLLNEIIQDPNKASSLTLKQSQSIKNAIEKAPAIASKLKMGKFAQYTDGERELLDLVANVKNAQLEVFPGLADIRKPYAEYMQNYNQVKNMFKSSSLLNKVRSGFGNEEIQQIINSVLPEKTIADIRGFRNAEEVVRIMKQGAGWLIGIGAGKAIYDRSQGR